MKVIGFNFSKIFVERTNNPSGSVKFNTKIDISSIDSVKSDFLRMREELLGINFTYSLQFEPEIAKLELAGNFVLSLEPKIAREALKDWKEKKQTPDDLRISILNIILKKANLKALQLEEDLNLPIHLPMPSLSKENMQQESKENN